MKQMLLILLVVLAGTAFWLFGKNKQTGTTPKQTATKYNFGIVIDSTIPRDLSPNATPEELVSFAWNEFFALNWQSSFDYTGKIRGYADRQWNYQNDRLPFPINPLVWETYAHRIELRPYDNNIQQFDKVPVYKYQPTINTYSGTDLTLFNNLDENNEIGSCDLYANTNTQGINQQVLYQAKVNRDEYEYIRDTYPDTNARKTIIKNNIQNIKNDSAYFKYAVNSCNCPPKKQVLCLPCGGSVNPRNNQIYTGSIEVKTAWRESLSPKDELDKYFIRRVIVYEKKDGQLYAMNKYYALIGMHIIHKTTNYPNFIFATFEHVDVTNMNMGYIELNQGNPTNNKPTPYDRAHPIPDVATAGTTYAHNLLRQKNSRSIWQNYRLIGVQSNPTNDKNAFSFYLANYVIESDPPLADFRGSGLGTPFDSGVNNLLQNGQATQQGRKFVSMGGCQGCHGVAQIKFGSDCSFLLIADNSFFVAPDVYNSRKDKLTRYQTLLQRMARLTEK